MQDKSDNLVFDKNDDGSRDPDADADLVSRNKSGRDPGRFFRIVLHVSGFIDTFSVWLPHTRVSVGSANTYLFNHITTIDAIEGLTGVDSLLNCPMNRIAVEAFKSPSQWHTQ